MRIISPSLALSLFIFFLNGENMAVSLPVNNAFLGEYFLFSKRKKNVIPKD